MPPGRRGGALALPAPAAALLGRSREPPRPAASLARPAASPCFSAVSTLAQAPRLRAPLRCREMQENTEASGQNRRWRCPSRLPARRSRGARRRELTVAVSLGCCAERNQAAKPQVSLLPDPLRCWCGTADPEAESYSGDITKCCPCHQSYL
ncbi:hypothetical protein RLOC_00006284 [Lonchura striata]|uniref:Uncharacterized protein n=1 Tax=Lonchura striata TaxID=40157 RepID=A0A218UGQ7_9PASE|nr:hypothetical protein RLOC_00006284 [Lonchura striata domestica]